jgi:hypothetical protein
MVVAPIERGGVAGLEIIAADRGGGIVNPTEARRTTARKPLDRNPSRPSLGIGLAAVFELADEVDLDVRVGEGTCVWARKFARGVERRRQVGVYGRALQGEAVSGDHGAFIRSENALLVGIADGVGHGAPARAASSLAVTKLRESAGQPVEQILELCDLALGETRGAVMAVARIAEPGELVELASVGNIGVHIYGIGTARRWTGSSFVLGAPARRRKVTREALSLEAREMLVLFSDGISHTVDLEGDLDLLREHPVLIAYEVVRRFARPNDDVLVLAVR